MLPLVRKDGQPELATEVFRELREHVQAEYDEGGAIGRRYRRQDEIGTPWAVTIDHQSLEDRTVTLRDRDSLNQIRVAIGELVDVIRGRLRRAMALAEVGRLAALAPAPKCQTTQAKDDDVDRRRPDLLRRPVRPLGAGQLARDRARPRTDREQWEHEFTELERRAALWTYSMFFHGEDAVADNLSPFIDAAPREEQKYFLATQQVDEARHAVLFARFMREVAGAGTESASALDATRPTLTWGFRKVFERLDRMADELRRDRSRPKLAQAITLYHIVIEASLAQPGQHFIEEVADPARAAAGVSRGNRQRRPRRAAPHRVRGQDDRRPRA